MGFGVPHPGCDLPASPQERVELSPPGESIRVSPAPQVDAAVGTGTPWSRGLCVLCCGSILRGWMEGSAHFPGFLVPGILPVGKLRRRSCPPVSLLRGVGKEVSLS